MSLSYELLYSVVAALLLLLVAATLFAENVVPSFLGCIGLGCVAPVALARNAYYRLRASKAERNAVAHDEKLRQTFE